MLSGSNWRKPQCQTHFLCDCKSEIKMKTRSSTVIDQLVYCKKTIIIKREIIVKKGIAIEQIRKRIEMNQEFGMQRKRVSHHCGSSGILGIHHHHQRWWEPSRVHIQYQSTVSPQESIVVIRGGWVSSWRVFTWRCPPGILPLKVHFFSLL